MRIEDIFEKEREHSKEVDDVINALDGITSVEVYDGGENFNIAFKDKDGVEHYIRPNDKGSEEFYVDSDDDSDEEVKVKDASALKSKVKSMV